MVVNGVYVNTIQDLMQHLNLPDDSLLEFLGIIDPSCESRYANNLRHEVFSKQYEDVSYRYMIDTL